MNRTIFFSVVVLLMALMVIGMSSVKEQELPSQVSERSSTRGDALSLAEEKVLVNLADIVESGDLSSLSRVPDFKGVVRLKAHGELLGFEADGIISTYPNFNANIDDEVRVVRYYGEETYFEFIFNHQYQLIAANEKLYPWVLKEKAKELEELMADYNQGAEITMSGSDSVDAASGWSATFKFPYQDEYSNVLSYYKGHCNCAYYAGDFNWSSGNNDCWLSVLNPARGIVISAGWLGNYGWQVQMYHWNSYWTLVAHGMTDPNNFISVGNDLLQGTFLMYRGSTGYSSYCHTHLEFWQGRTSKPLDGFSGYSNVYEGGTYRSYQTYVAPPKGKH